MGQGNLSFKLHNLTKCHHWNNTCLKYDAFEKSFCFSFCTLWEKTSEPGRALEMTSLLLNVRNGTCHFIDPVGIYLHSLIKKKLKALLGLKSDNSSELYECNWCYVVSSQLLSDEELGERWGGSQEHLTCVSTLPPLASDLASSATWVPGQAPARVNTCQQLRAEQNKKKCEHHGPCGLIAPLFSFPVYLGLWHFAFIIILGFYFKKSKYIHS